MFGGDVSAMERVPLSWKEVPGTTDVVFAVKVKVGVGRELKA